MSKRPNTLKEPVFVYKCQACGEADNCNFGCELITWIACEQLFCPISGEEAEFDYCEKESEALNV